MSQPAHELDWRDIRADAAGQAHRYLDTVTALPEIQRYKHASYDLVGAMPGAHVLDVGCGTGDDVNALAARVGRHGSATGVDSSPALIRNARQQAHPSSIFHVADACALPFDNACFDGVRADRVLMHIPEPDRAIAEMARVLRPGGQLVITEPDWYTLVVDPGDPDIGNRLLAAHFARVIQNPAIGRTLVHRLSAAGLLSVRIADYKNTVLYNLAAADRLFGLIAAVAESDTLLPGHTREVTAWRQALEAADHRDLFLCSLTGYTVHGHKTSEENDDE